MTTSENGIKFIMGEEGVILHPYQDSRGIWTIGVGSTYWEDGRSVKSTDKPITRESAMALFSTTLKRYENAVNNSIKRIINQNQFDACVSLCYNIGTSGFAGSTVVKKININPCDKTIADSFALWKNAGGKPVLLQRRQREAKLYFS